MWSGKSVRRFVLSILAALVSAAPNPARGQETRDYWTGGSATSSNWSDPANWDSLMAPVSGTTVTLLFAAVANQRLSNSNNVANPYVLNNLSFFQGFGAFVLGGNGLQFAGTTPTISQSSSAVQTINTNLSLAANTSVFASTVGNQPPVQSAGVVNLNGVISSQGGNFGLTFSGDQTATFAMGGSAANTYTGGVTVVNGTLSLSDTGGISVPAVPTSFNSGVNLTIGTAASASPTPSTVAYTPTVMLTQSNQLDPASNVAVTAGGGWLGNLNLAANVTQTIATLQGAGSVGLGTGSSLTLNPGAAGNNLTYSGSLTLANGSTLAFNTTAVAAPATIATNTITFGGAVVGTGAIAVSGPNPPLGNENGRPYLPVNYKQTVPQVIFSGANPNFQGTVNVKSGVLWIQKGLGSAPNFKVGKITVAAGAVFAGVKKVYQSASTINDINGFLKAGDGPGVLELGGSTDFHSGSTDEVEIDGATPGDGDGYYAQLIQDGDLLLDNDGFDALPTLQLDVDSDFVPQAQVGESFVIVDNESGDPVLNGITSALPPMFQDVNGAPLAEGADFQEDSFTWQITYQGSDSADPLAGADNNVVVTIVALPEPASAGLLAVAGLAVRGRRRRRLI
jgi:autotransporter-associated beta strand protein